ncbi:MAG: class I SAM-dependent methyltransferase [Acinetobacter sp.]
MNAFLKYQSQLNEKFINTVDTSSFENLCDSHIQFFKNYILPNFSYSEFSNRTQRAKNPLKLFEDLISYMALYGLGHYQRMRAIFDHVQAQSSFQLAQPVKATIVDYGCGQGIATLALLDHLIKSKHNIEELNIILIEPSTMALERAIYWINSKAQDAKIKISYTVHACNFDELDDDFLSCQYDYPYIHLFSNILDIYSTGTYSLYNLCQKITNQQSEHFVFAVSPDFSSGNIGFDTFHQYLQPQKIFLNAQGGVEIEEFNFKTMNIRHRKAAVRAYASYI